MLNDSNVLSVQCPLYGKARPEPAEGAPLRPMLPDLDTVEDGLIFRQCVRDRVVDSQADNQQFLASEEEGEVGELLAGFTKKEQRKILRKLAKMEAQGKGHRSEKKKRKHKHRRHYSDSSEDGGRGKAEVRSDRSDSSPDREKRKRRHHSQSRDKHRTKSKRSHMH